MIGNSVVAIARNVAANEANLATRMAQHRAPVRKVFKGGRNTIRTLTAQEINTAKARMLLAEPTIPVYKMSNREVKKPNRRNTYARSWNLREARLVGRNAKGFDVFNLSNAWQEHNRLNAEGRYALSHARIVEIGEDEFRDRGRGAIHIEIDAQGNRVYRLGGNLRASIRMREDSFEDVRYSVVAGGERAPYAKFMEFGTQHVAARPFLRPALKHVEQRFPVKLFNALDRAFPGHVRRG